MVVIGHALQTDEDGNQYLEGEIEISDAARTQGLYVVGTTGTGKTTLLKNIIAQDMESGAGLCVLDPHGDLTDELLQLVPEHRKDDVILFAPGELKDQYEFPLGLNFLSFNRDDPHEVDLVQSTVVGTLRKLFYYSWGPRMEELLRNSILTLMEWPDTTLLDLWILLANQLRRKQLIERVKTPFLWNFWTFVFHKYTDHDQAEIAGSSLNKIGRFLGNPIIRNIVAQPKNAFDLKEIMNQGKILFCNLSKGDLGEDNSSLLGAVIVNLILIAALARRHQHPTERKLFHLIVDEYQSFATETFPTLQTEARKFGITVTVAHQYRDQLDDLNKGSTLNVANLVCLRVTGRDSLDLANQFDNTPPPPEQQMQHIFKQTGTVNGRPVYKPGDDPRGWQQYHEVDLPQRLYADVAAQRANQLSVLLNQDALVRVLEGRQLKEYLVQLADPDADLKKLGSKAQAAELARRNAIAEHIRAKSRKLGQPRKAVEKFIEKRYEKLPIVSDQEPRTLPVAPPPE